MTRLALLLVAVLSVAALAGAAAGAPAPDRSILWRAEAGEGVEGFRAPGPAGPGLAGYPAAQESCEVLDYDLALRVFFDTRSITGTATLRLRALYGGLDRVGLDLHDSLRVSSVRRDGNLVAFTQGAGRVIAVLDTVFGTGGEFDLAVQYAGRPQPLVTKGLKFDTHALVNIAYTLSTPYSTGLTTVIPISSRWRPCLERPDDKSTSSFHITVPDTFLASSNGVLTGVTSNHDGTHTCHWRESYPIAPYLMCFSATNYDTLNDGYVAQSGDTMNLTHYVFPEQAGVAAEAFNRVPQMIGALAAPFGEYPFVSEQYGMSTIRGSTAVENQTMTSFPSGLVLADHSYDWIVAHELAHQWWGDCVTVADWDHVWLSEGLASYAEALWFESRGGSDSLRWWMETMTGPYPGSLVDPDYIWVSTVYDKGAWVAHMLRRILGDAAFFEALADYRAAHEYANVVTDDFQVAMEGRYGAPLDWFFDPWVYGTGFVRYAQAWSAQAAGDSFLVRVEVRQTQPLSEPTYAMPLDLRIVTAAGARDFTAWNDGRAELYEFLVDAAPTGVQLDPGHWILRAFDAFPTEVAAADPAAAASPPALEAFPNPTREASTLRFRLAEDGDARLALYDARGRRLREWDRPGLAAGAHHVTWDGRDGAGRELPPGLYFARLIAGAETRETKILRVP